MFRVIPAIDLKGGKVVRLRQGREKEVTFEAENPLEIAKNWVSRGAKVLHVIDLDGAFEGKLRHEREILDIISLGIEVQVGGGIRDLNLAERLLKLGVQRVIFGTLAIEKVEDVRDFAEKWKGRVMVAMDVREGRVVFKGWKEKSSLDPLEFARLYE
ncbi:MAG: HisA/HisF-related TIM barrel protein, partial [Archaeoglobaceae archaeon]